MPEKDVNQWSDPPQEPTVGGTLAPDELRRADRYRFERDRRRFIVARGVLRAILSRYTGVEPGQLRFRYGAQGKPQLVGETGREALRFNLSHAHELVLFAVARGRAIGVDLEYVRRDLADLELAERFFSPTEVAVLRALPAYARCRAFFNCWTRKEAYIKAKGGGLSIPLDQFDVTLGPGKAAALVEARWDAEEASRWSLHGMDPAPGYVAALAVQGRAWELAFWRWNHR